MARIPVVGTKDVHAAQLSPELRRLLYRRAKGANRREYAPVLQADRQAFGGINQAYQNEASSVRGASQMTEEMLAQALQGLKASGLSGKYLQQATSELTSRQGDAAAAVPFLLSDAREARSSALTDARQQLAQDRASMLQGTAQDFNSSLESARGDASQVLKEQEEARSSASPKFDSEALSNARLALRSALSKWSENPTIKVGDEEIPLQQYNPLQTKDQWLQLAHELEKEYGGFDLRDVNHVIAELLTDRQKKLHEGRLPQPGVPGPGRG